MPTIVGEASAKFKNPKPKAQKKYFFSRCSTERLQKNMQKGSKHKIPKENINAFCTSPFPAIINADKRDNDTKNILIGTSSNEVAKLKAVALLSMKNFNENWRPNNTKGNKNLKGTLVKKSICQISDSSWIMECLFIIDISIFSTNKFLR